MRKKLLAFFVASLTVLCLSGIAGATIIFSDNFENDTVGLNKTNFNNWTVSDGSVDLIGTGTSWNWFPTYGKYVDMDGSTGNAGKMISSGALNLSIGDYILKFDLAGNQRPGFNPNDTVSVNVNTGVSSHNYSLTTLDPFQTFTEYFSLYSAKTVSLSFEGIGGDNVGMLLDNIVLERVNAPVPEPSTMLLLGGGLAGLVFWRRKKS